MRSSTVWSLAGCLAVAPAWAQPEPSGKTTGSVAVAAHKGSAKDLYEAGGAAYQRGQYQVAVEAFEAAWQLSERPAVAFALAQAHRLQWFVVGELPHLERAVELYQRYLTDVREGGRRDHAAQHLSTLVPLLEARRNELDGLSGSGNQAERPARIIVTSRTPGALAQIDDGERSVLPATFETNPGPHHLRVEAPDHRPQTVDAVGVGGTVVAFNVDLVPEPGRLTVLVPLETTLLLDGRAMPHDGGKTAMEVLPGRHLLTVAASGRASQVHLLTLEKGQAQTLSPELALSGQRVAAGVVLGLSGVLLVGAGAGLGLALNEESKASEMERRYAQRGFTLAEARRYGNVEDDRDRFRTLGVGLGVAAGAAAITGLLLWIFDTPALPTAGFTEPAPSPETVENAEAAEDANAP
jgi:tetratricopeptide (TPR) repeat protein